MEFEKLRDLENSIELGRVQWLGVSAWDFLRYYVVHGKGEKVAPSMRMRRRYFSEISSWVRVIRLWGSKKHLFLGTNLNRYQERNGLKDPWCDPIIDTLGRDMCIKFYAGESDSRVDGWSTEFLKSVARIVRRFGPQRAARRTAAQVKALCDMYDISAPSERTICGILLDRWATWKIYRYLLRRLRPRSMFVVCSYAKEPQIIAAQSLNIPVLELQHGVISEKHLGYSFPYGYKKKAFPDFLLTYGPYWHRNITFPIADDHVVDVGFAWNELADTSLVETRKVILFISQWTMTDQIQAYAKEFAALAVEDDISVVVRLHPRESLTSEQIGCLQSAGLTVQQPETVPLLTAIGAASIIVGVSSTALFEALFMGKPVYIISELSDARYMIEIPRIDEPEVFFKSIREDGFPISGENNFFSVGFFSKFEPRKISALVSAHNFV